jgi:excisionase family DNA binding protein
MTSNDNLQLLSPETVAELLGVPKATLYAWRSRDEGPKGFKIGKHLRYRRSEVERWLDERARAS